MTRTAGKAKTAANHSEDLLRLRKIRGQIEGVERMISDGRYCIDIINQMRSITAALKSAEALVIERHIRHCVKDAVQSDNTRTKEDKINELLALFQRR